MSKRLLGFLLPAFIASLIYGYLQMPKQERITTGTQRPQTSNKQQTLKENEGYPRLRSDLLDRKSQPYPGVHRNLFSNSLPVEKVEVYVEEPAPDIIPQIVVTPPPPPLPSPQDVAQKEIARYKFLGFLKKGEKKTIFLSSDGEILLVKKGSYLGRDRKYFVLNVTDKTLELRKEGVGDFSITLSDQESLSAVSLRNQSKPEQVPSLRPVQETNAPDQPEFLTIPDEAPTDDHLQPEEDN